MIRRIVISGGVQYLKEDETWCFLPPLFMIYESTGQGGKKLGSAGAGLPQSEDVARIVILAAKNSIGVKLLVQKLIYKMSRMKISTGTKHKFTSISS